MKRLALLSAWLLIFISVAAQQITLQECLEAARLKNPLASNRDLITNLQQLNSELLNVNWFPSLSINGQASWQSEVVEFSMDLPFEVNFPQMPHDQYKLTMDVQQLIYDGGLTKVYRMINSSTTASAELEVDLTDQQIKKMVVNTYFSIISTEKQLEIFDLIKTNLSNTRARLVNQNQGGIIATTDLYLFDAEIHEVEEKVIRLVYAKKKMISVLGILIQKDIDDQATFLLPDDPVGMGSQNRVETKLLDSKISILDLQMKLNNRFDWPKVIGFGQVGYGKPGLNFLSNAWNPFAIVGLKMSWVPWNWHETRTKNQKLAINQEILHREKDQFIRQNDMESIQNEYELKMLNEQQKELESIAEIRSKITDSSQSKLSNGLITVSDFIKDLNLQKESLIRLESCNLEMIATKYKLLSIKGNL